MKYMVIWEQRSFSEDSFDTFIDRFEKFEEMEQRVLSLANNRTIDAIKEGTPFFKILFLGKIASEWELGVSEIMRDNVYVKEIIWNEL